MVDNSGRMFYLFSFWSIFIVDVFFKERERVINLRRCWCYGGYSGCDVIVLEDCCYYG